MLYFNNNYACPYCIFILFYGIIENKPILGCFGVFYSYQRPAFKCNSKKGFIARLKQFSTTVKAVKLWPMELRGVNT